MKSEREWRRRRLLVESAREREGRLQSERERRRRELAGARERRLERERLRKQQRRIVEGQARAATLEHERLRRQELMAAQQRLPREIALLDQPGIYRLPFQATVGVPALQ